MIIEAINYQPMTILKRDFFARPTLTVARELLGQHLVREIDGQRISGKIVETEAYIGEGDSASHARNGLTQRNEVMFGLAAYTYVYLIYGMYHMLNFITEQEGFPAAVLIRAVEPLEGLAVMQSHRRRRANRSAMKQVNLTNGPGKLCQALGVDQRLNKWDATKGEKLWVARGDIISDASIATGPRIGIDYAAPQDRDAPWRFWIHGNRFVSK